MRKLYYAAFTATSERASRISAVAESSRRIVLPYRWAFTHPAWRLPGESKSVIVRTHREVRYDY